MEETKKLEQAIYLIWPIQDPIITQRFGENPEDYLQFGYPAHNGLDVSTWKRPAYVFVVLDGQVQKVGWEAGGYGKYVVVAHSGGFTTLYAHLDTVSVSTGQRLSQGDIIGIMGSTGNSTGPHLHLGMRFDQSVNPAYKGYVDPLPYLQGKPIQLEPEIDPVEPQPETQPKPPTPVVPKPQQKPPATYSVPYAVLIIKRGKKSVYRMKRYF